MPVDLQFLEKNNFIYSHDLVLEKNWPIFVSKRTIPKEASVYMWLKPISTTHFEVLYIGKAGYGVEVRFGQHSGGFKNSKTGIANRKLIENLLCTIPKIVIYVRISSTQQFFNFDSPIPLYSVEEEALCEQFAPLWNRAKFPKKTKKQNVKDLKIGDEVLGEGNLEIDFSDLAYGSEVNNFYDSLDQNDRSLLIKLLNFISETPELSRLQQKIVGQYTNLTTGYTNVPIINFALLHESGQAVAKSWGARIPLISSSKYPLTIFFPKKYHNQNCPENLIEWGSGDVFRPKNLNLFLDNPSTYLTL